MEILSCQQQPSQVTTQIDFQIVDFSQRELTQGIAAEMELHAGQL